MKQNNKKFNNAMHKFVRVLDKYANQSRKIWHFSQHICVVLKVKTAYVSITSCLGSIVRCFQFFRVSSPSGKGASYEPPTPLGNFCL